MSKHTRNGPITDVQFDNGSYFMATDSLGKLWISQNTFARCGNYNPADALKKAWNNIAAGKPLSFNEEHAIKSVWHETIHNREIPDHPAKGSNAKDLMETVTEWVARRTYPGFLKSLGGQEQHQRQLLTKAYTYSNYLHNFDKLRTALGIADDSRMLDFFERVIRNTSRLNYRCEIVNYFQREAKFTVERTELERILSTITDLEADFESNIRLILKLS